MELYLKHGRKNLLDEMNDWGPEGPRLQGVKGIHQTYGTPANVFFDTPAASQEAQRLTGWHRWEDDALTMVWKEDCIAVKGPDGDEMFFGDWGLI